MASPASIKEVLRMIQLEFYEQLFENYEFEQIQRFTDSDLTQLGINIRIHRVKILHQLKSSISSQLSYSQTETEFSEPNSQNEFEEFDISNQSFHCFEFRAVSGYLQGMSFKIGEKGASIGRSTNREIVIPDSFVSRKHCKVGYLSDIRQFYLQDTCSTTGTYVMVRKAYSLKIGSLFQVGLSEFKVLNIVYTLSGRASSIELAQYEGITSVPIIITKGGVIGRSLKAEISNPNDSLMSVEHAELYSENGSFFIRDLGSHNQTWIRLSNEGEKSEFYYLQQGDFIKIGFIVFLVMKSHTSRTLTDDFRCAACKQAAVEIEALPCCHRFCMDCASLMKNCFTCKLRITDFMLRMLNS
jgi:pSer/pThr/pTyr-binding forkhead associated (FHA) protein